LEHTLLAARHAMNAIESMRAQVQPPGLPQLQGSSRAVEASSLVSLAEGSWRATVLDYPTAPRALEAVQTLISSVEALLSRLPAADSQLGRLRAQATNALAAAKSAVAVAGNAANESLQPAPARTASLEAYVRKWPRTSVAMAATLGLALGLTAVRYAGRRRRSA
jgi:ElaB/YqjD/DUF883 family membrane-anchored ribosome-binding protein